MKRHGRRGGKPRASLPIALVFLVIAASSLQSTAKERPPAGEAAGEFSFRVELDRGEVELGAPFSLVVVRTWRETLRPEPWEEAWPEGMQVRREGRERRSLPGGVVEERTRYTCRAFTLHDIVIPAMEFRARPEGGGAERITRSRPVTLRVKRLLDPERPGDAELPPGLPAPPPRPRGWIYLLSAGGLLLAAGAVHFFRSRARRRAAALTPGPQTPRQRALAALDELRDSCPEGRVEMDACHTALSEVLRTFLEDGLWVRALARTTEESTSDPVLERLLPPAPRALLIELLAAVDRVKFGGAVPGAGAWAEVLDRAERFVKRLPENGAREAEPGAGMTPAAGEKEAHP